LKSQEDKSVCETKQVITLTERMTERFVLLQAAAATADIDAADSSGRALDPGRNRC
jgi:hypothetical protein